MIINFGVSKEVRELIQICQQDRRCLILYERIGCVEVHIWGYRDIEDETTFGYISARNMPNSIIGQIKNNFDCCHPSWADGSEILFVAVPKKTLDIL